MREIVGDFSTSIILEGTEATTICKLGQGEKCCAFLIFSLDGYECCRMDYPTNTPIFKKLEEGTMHAKGTGGWEGCPWHGTI